MKLGVIHVTYMFVLPLMSMVLRDNLFKQFAKSCVRVMASSIDAYSRVDVLATGEDGLLESEAKLVMGVLKIVPDFGSQVH